MAADPFLDMVENLFDDDDEKMCKDVSFRVCARAAPARQSQVTKSRSLREKRNATLTSRRFVETRFALIAQSSPRAALT